MWRALIGVLILSAFAVESPAPSAPATDLQASGSAVQGVEAADSSQPAAGACGGPESGPIATFALGIDTPIPRCGLVRPDQRLRLINETSAMVTVTLHGTDYVLVVGAQLTFTSTFGSIWEPGVHDLRTSLYGGGGPEILLVRP